MNILFIQNPFIKNKNSNINIELCYKQEFLVNFDLSSLISVKKKPSQNVYNMLLPNFASMFADTCIIFWTANDHSPKVKDII